MRLEAGKKYRAKTVAGNMIAFRLIDAGSGQWLTVDLETAEGPEPNLWLNLSLLLWISSDEQRTLGLRRATEEVIQKLDDSPQPEVLG